MKKVISTVLFIAAVCYIWFDLLMVDAREVVREADVIYIDPERAIICAVTAALVGIIIFVVRHRERMKR